MAPSRVSGLRRLGQLLQRTDEPVYVLDGQRRFAYANRAWELVTGVEAEAVAGLTCLPPGGPETDPLAALAQSLGPPPEAVEGRDCSGPVLIARPDGERRWLRVEFTVYRDAAGVSVAWLGRLRELEGASRLQESPLLRVRAELEDLRRRVRERAGTDLLIGRGPAHQRLLDQIRAAAGVGVPVLIAGEAGTGKRTVARAIHRLSPRSGGALLPFDCVAIPAELLERELLGAPASDGVTTQTSRIPDDATILLIDAFRVPRDLQDRIAAILDGPRRFLATTALEPQEARRQEVIRADYYYGLTAFVVRLEPLRERLAELPLLAQETLERLNRRNETRRAGFEAEALEVLARYDWPGNLRELGRVVEWAHQRAPGELIRAADLPGTIRGERGGAYLPPALQEKQSLDELLTMVERHLIEGAMNRARQNKSRAADLLGISRPRLYRRIKELGMPDLPETGADAEPGEASDPA